MKNCFGYIRVSTAKQGEGVSLQAQKEAIQAFADRRGLVVSRWFEEKETAAKRGRPVFTTMIQLLRNGKAEGLIIHKIDRSARNFADWAKIGELNDQGIDIHFATETLDFRSRGGRLTADIQAVIAADYIRNLREETIKGINGRLQQGLYPFRAPIGYLDTGKGQAKVPDPSRAPLIRAMFELYASGEHSLRSLQQVMNQRGLRNVRGNPLSLHGVETILNNPFYCGVIRIHTTGHVYKGIHEKIVSLSLFERVQKVKQGKSGPKVTRHNHLFRGLFRCGLCNAAMTPELQKGTVYYRCQKQRCPTKTVREDQIETALSNMFATCRFTDRQASIITTRLERQLSNAATTSKGLASLNMQRANLSSRMDRLTDAMIDHVIDRETYMHRRQSLLLETARIDEEIEEIGKTRKNIHHLKKFLELMKNPEKAYVSADHNEKRHMVRILTSNRSVNRKSVFVEPQKWLLDVKQLSAVSAGDPCRYRDRTFSISDKFSKFLEIFH